MRVAVTARGLELPVLIGWRSLGYQRFGRCATCGCTRTGEGKPMLVAGINTDSLVCVSCFEFEHDCKPPNYRRRSRLH